MSNILILQGSPRANGNTAWMAEEFKKAAEEAGHTVNVCNVAKMKINGCLACEYCHTKGNGQCVQKDDFQQLLPLYAEADVVVVASPIYYLGMNAATQAAIERIYCVMAPQKMKKMALLLSSMSPMVYDGAIGQYKALCGFFKAQDLGIVTAKGDEQKTDATAQKVRDLVKGL